KEWSRHSAAYHVGTCEAKWGTFTPGGLTIGSLYVWAQEEAERQLLDLAAAGGNVSGNGQAPTAGQVGALPVQSFNLSDLGNAQRLVYYHGKWARYCEQFKAWFTWDGTRWVRD